MSDSIMSFRGKYEFLSNMFAAKFEWDGRTYLNSEAAFQSAKSLDPVIRDEFSELSGKDAKKKGGLLLLMSDWEDVKDGIMEEVVRAKFSQNPELLQKLIDTGDTELVEGNSWHDTYWGVDQTSKEGENRLGKILMKIRSELGGSEYLEKAIQMKAEKEEAKRSEDAALKEELESIRTELDSMPVYDFTGMEMKTKAFGRVKILSQEGHILKFEARGEIKEFALPGCITRGFLIPDDNDIVESYKRRQELEKRLKLMEKSFVENKKEMDGPEALKRQKKIGAIKTDEGFEKYESDPAAEKEWQEKNPMMSLADALVLTPNGQGLSESAIDAIRHMRYYMEAEGGIVLFSDSVVAIVDAGSISSMIKKAKSEARIVTSNMPDFEPLDMDDDCGLLHMTQAEIYAFKPYKLSAEGYGSLKGAFEARVECLEVCEKKEPIAVVYFDQNDYKD